MSDEADVPAQPDALADLVGVVTRLRRPGGCPWDAEQTHESLVTYLVEEAYELVDAIETGDVAGIREELGDVLYQVLFHADIAAVEEGFDIADVARDAAAKMRSRHPHVFGDAQVSGVDDVVASWDALKRAEKSERESALDGIPPGLPALALAQKTLQRARRAGLVTLPEAEASAPSTEAELGAALLAMVEQASAHGVDAERALRLAVRERDAELRAGEREAGAAGDAQA
ncbi:MULTISPECIES: MazG family protein [unclassified Agrococcus]|uniref:MazG family protein n=1 Tax=unclassified Agrococcus TaxID=2615065 RepID=UPI00361C019E